MSLEEKPPATETPAPLVVNIVERPKPEVAEPATKQQLANVERQMTSFERATLRWAKIAVLMSFLAAVFVCAQWYEMHMGGEDTHALARAADVQARRMADVSSAADKIRQAAQDMVSQDGRIADNAQKSLEASNHQSKTALEATIEQNRLDERPWVGIGVFRVSRFEQNKPVTVDVELINSGKTPALNVTNWLKYRYSTVSQLGPLPVDWAPQRWDRVGSIPPQGRTILHIYLDWNTWEHNLGSLALHRSSLSFFGEISYNDFARVSHRTQLCIFMNDSETHELSFCDGWNDMS